MMRKFIMWFLLLNKRLYKKATFIIILALIPLAVLVLGVVAKEESGVVKVALASKGDGEQLYNEIKTDLKNSSKLVYFLECDNEKSALKAVENGDADMAWVFNANLKQGISDFSKNYDKRNYIVNVTTRESNVIINLTLEKLSGVLYRHVSRDFYINYVRSEYNQLDSLSDKEIMNYYDAFESDDKLFAFDNPDTSSVSDISNYMTTPIRGLLAIITVICGFAAAMFYIDDDKKGTFAWIKQKNKIFVQFGCVAIAVLNVSLVMMISLFFAGVNVSIWREIVSLLAFVPCCCVFCVLLSQLLPKVYILGSLIPIMTVLMLVLCPVLFDYGGFREYQFIFPPTYYISSAYNTKYYLYAIIYFVVLSTIAIIVNFIKQKRIKL